MFDKTREYNKCIAFVSPKFAMKLIDTSDFFFLSLSFFPYDCQNIPHTHAVIFIPQTSAYRKTIRDSGYVYGARKDTWTLGIYTLRY